MDLRTKMKLVLFLFALPSFSVIAQTGGKNEAIINRLKAEKCPECLLSADVPARIGEEVSVIGKVVDIVERTKGEDATMPIYFDIDKKFDDKNPTKRGNSFALKLFPENRAKFLDYKKYKGKFVKITGKVIEEPVFADRPDETNVKKASITLTKPSQLQLLEP